ncbi:MAG TPA: hypothetical protein VNR68_06740 [Sphingomicrobium sp.]|nr:hypothetical protein [Sphingomicrobium sp.]
MSESEPSKPRRKWIALGEIIALAALVISALGLWNSWKRDNAEKSGPTEVLERKSAVPLVLRGRIADDGKKLRIAPIETSHALESLTLKPAKADTIEIDSEGILDAGALDDAAEALDPKRKGTGTLRVTIDARYVEAGVERRASHAYAIGYRWDGGGLFGGSSLRLTSFRRT